MKHPIWIAAAAASIFIALVINAVLMWRSADSRDKDIAVAKAKVVGALTLAKDCKWASPLMLGDHLLFSEVP